MQPGCGAAACLSDGAPAKAAAALEVSDGPQNEWLTLRWQGSVQHSHLQQAWPSEASSSVVCSEELLHSITAGSKYEVTKEVKLSGFCRRSCVRVTGYLQCVLVNASWSGSQVRPDMGEI